MSAHSTARTGLPPVHPGEILREQILPALRITAAEAAASTGLTPAAIDALLHERADVTDAMATALSALGMPPHMWLTLQANVDRYHRLERGEIAPGDPWIAVPIGGGFGWLCPVCSRGHVMQPDEVRLVPDPQDHDAVCEGCNRTPARAH